LLDDDHEAYFYRTQAGAEVDLVIARGLDPFVCIEVKYSSEPKISKSFQNSISDLQTRMNFIITPNSERYKLSEIIEVVSLSTFITLVMTELGISQP
jgi:predicted AAA+ superfamily ATPase